MDALSSPSGLGFRPYRSISRLCATILVTAFLTTTYLRAFSQIRAPLGGYFQTEN